jgi:hypothetical protein
MMSGKYLGLPALLVFVTSTSVVAQTTPAGNMWSHGTTVDVFAGVAAASSRGGALAGGAAGWEITPRFGLEGRMAWFDRPARAEAFAAALAARANLMSARTAVPFVKGGVGLYRASFEAADGNMPDFYRRRLGPGFGLSRTFTDPSFVVGGGVSVFTSRHWAVRPEIEATVVRRQSRSYVVTAVTMGVAYHFEEHPVTPAGERR